MTAKTVIRFSRSCPTCGRRIQIRSGLLGKTVACRHCKAEFVAMSSDETAGSSDEAQLLMERVELALLKSQSVLPNPVASPII